MIRENYNAMESSKNGAPVQDSMVALVCEHPQLVEEFYRRNFGFQRARVYFAGTANEVVVLKTGTTYLQLFPAFQPRPKELDIPAPIGSPYPGGSGAGPLYSGVRKLAFLVDNIEKQLERMGPDARITQTMRPGLIPGSRMVWIADPVGNIIELIEAYFDEASPPSAPRHPRPQELPWRREPEIEIAVVAARTGNLEVLKNWLSQDGDPNQYDPEGWTPLLAAAVRGQVAAVKLLLGNANCPASPDIAHRVSGALPIHFAGHSGSTDSALALLKWRPEHLEEIWEINGHTLLLQAAFYGHEELTKFSLMRGANTAATTVRGLAAMELAKQFGNTALMALIEPYDSTPQKKAAYFQSLLRLIAPTTPPEEEAVQKLSDELCATIEKSLKLAADSPTVIDEVLAKLRDLVVLRKTPVNRLGGVLRQPPLVVAVTGNNGIPPVVNVARLRHGMAEFLLENGADPTLREVHPMGVHAIIRAAVFNHLEILKMMASFITGNRLRDALNEQPAVNGLTALHDSVLRAGTAGPSQLPGYLDQISWFIANGARSDIEDYSGRTQIGIAEGIKDPSVRDQVLKCLIELPSAP